MIVSSLVLHQLSRDETGWLAFVLGSGSVVLAAPALIYFAMLPLEFFLLSPDGWVCRTTRNIPSWIKTLFAWLCLVGSTVGLMLLSLSFELPKVLLGYLLVAGAMATFLTSSHLNPGLFGQSREGR